MYNIVLPQVYSKVNQIYIYLIAIPFSSGPLFVRTLHHTHPSWVALHGMAHSFIELDKAVAHVISLISLIRQDEKEMTKDEMVGWHHQLDEHELEQAPGVGDGQ